MTKRTAQEKSSRYSYNPQKENAMLPKRLNELMRKNNMTQDALAKAIDVSRQSVSNYQNGRVFPPSGTLDKLSKYFGVTTDYLLGKTDCETETPNKRSACDYTGLSSEAVDRLNEAIMNSNQSPVPMLSHLICRDEFWQLLLSLKEMLTAIDHAEDILKGEKPIEAYYQIYDIDEEIIRSTTDLYEYILRSCQEELRTSSLDVLLSSRIFDSMGLTAANLLARIKQICNSHVYKRDEKLEKDAELYFKNRPERTPEELEEEYKNYLSLIGTVEE